MLNIFLLSLQRTGSNFLEVLLNSNISDLCVRSQMYCPLEDKNFNKHVEPCVLTKFDKAPIKQDYFFLITKNPYMWMESVALIHEMGKKGEVTDIQKTIFENNAYYENYNLFEDGDFGDNNYNFENLAGLYKGYYESFLEKTKDDDRVIIIKYEDFLHEGKGELVLENLAELTGRDEFRSDGILRQPNKPVRYSDDFTRKDFEYYKNESAELLTDIQKSQITNIIGKELIEKLGYEAIN
jgi:hypothetical protein